MSSIKLKGSSSGDVTITVPAAAGTNTVTIPAVTGTLPLSNLDHVTNRQNAKPLIINGDMHVAQRATSVSSLSSDSYAVVDRMKNKLNDAGTYTISQSTDVPSGYGFTKSLKYDVTTAKDSPSAGTLGSLDYHIEAQDLQLLRYGTSNAQKLTFSFWVKSPKTGTHILSLTSEDGSRHIAKAYTIASADTWENHIVNFDGDTGGTINDDNGSGFQIQWLLVAGSNYQSGTLATSWASYTAANAYVGQVNCADNASNDFFITGIQMEIGEFTSATIPPFQHESYGDSLSRCQRYFFKTFAQGTTPAQNVAANNNLVNGAHTSISDARFPTYELPVEMRAAGTATSFNPYAANANFRVPGSSTDVTISSVSTTTHAIYFNCTSADTGVFHIHFTVDSEL